MAVSAPVPRERGVDYAQLQVAMVTTSRSLGQHIPIGHFWAFYAAFIGLIWRSPT
jgi:hypothetical protein